MRVLRWMCVVIAGWLLSAELSGQELVLRHLDEEHGLPSNCVFDLYIDSQGLLWVSTNKGLYRYDGFSFERIGAGTPLDQYFVIEIIEGPENGAFFFSCTGGHLFRYEQGRLNEWINPRPGSLKADGSAYKDLVFDSTGALLMNGGRSPGAYRVDMDARQFQQITRKLRSRYVELIGGVPWGFMAYDGRGSMDDSLRVDLPWCRRSWPVQQMEQLTGVYTRVTTSGDVIAHANGRLVRVSKDGRSRSREFDHAVLGVLEEPGGRLWVRLLNGGIRCVDDELLDVADVRPAFEKEHVTDAVRDAQGGIWFATLSKGLFYCANALVKNYPAEKLFGVPYLTALALDERGRPYVGASNGTVSMLVQEGRARVLVPEEKRMCNSEIKTIVPETPEQIWLGGLKHTFDPTEGTLSESDRTDRLVTSAAHDILRLRDGRLLVATHNTLRIHDPVTLDTIRSVVEGMRPTRLCPAGAPDHYWVTTSQGLYAYAAERLTRVSTSDTLLGLRMHDALLLGDTLWIATVSGMVMYARGQSRALQAPNSPWGTSVRDLALSEGRWIWCATLNGLLRYDRRDPLAAPFRMDRSRGLPSNVVYQVAAQDDVIHCISGTDLCRFKPSEFQPTRELPKLLVLELRTQGGSFPGGSGHSFPHTIDHVSVVVQHAVFSRFLGSAFRYRQAGTEVWTQTDEPVIDLVGLKPGSYRLEIQASDGNGTWLPSAYAEWVIATPFWQAGWFYVLLCFSGSLAISGAIHVRVTRDRRERSLIAEARHARHRALLAQMEPHFVYNALNSIQDFVLRNKSADSARYLARFAKLMRGLLNASDKEFITVAEEMELLEHYCALEALRYEPAFTFHIAADPGLDTREATLPALLIQPYVENAIRHGLRHLEGRRAGHVHILFGVTPQRALQCVVEDNGVGRAVAEGHQRSSTPAFVSQGTRINADRIAILELGARDGHYTVQVDDVLDERGEVVGTRVVITLGIQGQLHPS